MSWRVTQAGKGYERPSSEDGVQVDGPLTVEDLTILLEDIAKEIARLSFENGRESVYDP